MEAFGLEAYFFEPEYSEEELRHREEELSKDSQSATVCDVGSNSVADTSTSSASHCEEWCLCALCSPLESEKERVCCHGLFAEKAVLNVGECLTNSPEFSQICLQPVNLELCFVNFLRYKKKDPTAAENMTNRQRRLMAYTQLALWPNYSVPLGKGVRIVLPSCCVGEIRSHFPEDSHEQYIGFREVTEALQLE
ncbi:P2X purinoceptor 7-like [Apostichopus japonicus]|uniref:P2X purinoceptor 7-like n=1 Tax=Stichopus japonicus TaxID=307972 RepID=UPI003AB4C332